MSDNSTVFWGNTLVSIMMTLAFIVMLYIAYMTKDQDSLHMLYGGFMMMVGIWVGGRAGMSLRMQNGSTPSPPVDTAPSPISMKAN